MSSDARSWDLLIVGGGPAGMAAAARAAGWGLRVCLVDDNAALGGQIWRGAIASHPHGAAARWAERMRVAGATVLTGMRVFSAPEPGVLLAEQAEAPQPTGLDPTHPCAPSTRRELRYRNLLLATGARERFLPFPGWTLRNVLGAGGLQALVKSGLPLAGKRVVVAGSGPLLLAVAAYLREHGAEIPLICEQASWRALAGFGAGLLSHPGKLGQGLGLGRQLWGVPLATDCWPIKAEGAADGAPGAAADSAPRPGETIAAVTVLRKGQPVRVECDYLACGFHLAPNIELPLLLGCQAQHGCVAVDEWQRTSMPNVFCAGEPTGIGGVDAALLQGQIAAAAVAGKTAAAAGLLRTRNRWRRFARAMDGAFRLRAELRNLPNADTIVCRCEDVTYGRLAAFDFWRAAKLHTRCGMGPCQGRICGPAAQFLFAWHDVSIRPPLFPVQVGTLAASGPGDGRESPGSGGAS